MNFKTYSKWNTIFGWAIFLIAAFTYLSTMEWTVSLWDCGEFVPAAYKLEIPHPPGAPFFILTNRIFTMFAGGNTKMVPILANASSAIFSALSILFLFWSITALAFKVMIKDELNIDKGNIFAILGAGAVGALAYCWSDTFWFSAVEGEVYAQSSFYTALIFWLVMKWERRADEARNLRWMVLIFYMVGFVIGVHLLGLLVIPVVVLVYYYKRYPNPTPKGIAIALGIGFASLGIVQIGVIQWLLSFAAKTDLFFVNSLGMPFWSGVIFFFGLVFAACGFLLYRTNQKQQIMAHTAILCFMMTVIGYTSYAASVIRSYANPPIDMNDPQDAFTLFSYVSREQYGDSYLLTGPYYTAYEQNKDGQPRYEVKEGAMQYRRSKVVEKDGVEMEPDNDSTGKDQYYETGLKEERRFLPGWTTFFPRMYSPQDNHKGGYRYWAGIKHYPDQQLGREVYEDEEDNFKFKFVDHNLRFFWTYQMNYMYFRYFAWNFIGRQNDMQGTQGEFHQGNWITGVKPLDQALGNGPQTNLPTLYKKNKAHNALFGLPFILGILGMVFQWKKNRKDFIITALFFFMTGLAIALYLNMPNPQPRERDYAFVGSFYVFAIWIGLGVLFIYEFLVKAMKNTTTSAILSSGLCLVAVPVIMLSQEWDDHDRSKRMISLDYGVDYLESCAKNAVLFCNGDNDTYPLWYAQEVEGIRDDIRILNLSLLSTDWYIDEMRKPVNHAPALTFSLTPKQCLGWDYIYVNTEYSTEEFNKNTYSNLNHVMRFLGLDSPGTKYTLQNGKTMPFLPTKKFRIPVNKEAVLANGTVKPEYAQFVQPYMDFDMNRGSLLKSDVMVLDFIATNAKNNWKIPVYFSITSGPSEYLNMGKYLQQEGLAYRLVPFTIPDSVSGIRNGNEPRVESDIMYNNLVNKFKFGKMDEGDRLVDYVTSRQCNNMRSVYARLAMTLIAEGKKDKAITVLDKAMAQIPERNIPYDAYVAQMADIYFRAGAVDKAKPLANRVADMLIEEVDYYSRVKNKPKQFQFVEYDTRRAIEGLRILLQDAKAMGDKQLENKISTKIASFSAIMPEYFDQQGPGGRDNL